MGRPYDEGDAYQAGLRLRAGHASSQATHHHADASRGTVTETTSLTERGKYVIRLSVRFAIDLRAPERDRREGRRNGKAGSNHGQARIGWISHRRSSSLFDADRWRPGQPH
jgi:hypothetical protein